MTLSVEQKGRVYQCPDRIDCGYVSNPLDPGYVLSIDEISCDMMQRRYVDASQEAAKQALYRRLSAQLSEFTAGRQYLSEQELSTLNESAYILEKLASAAEISKRAKHQQALESQQMIALRTKKLFAELDCSDLYDEDNLVDLALHVLTLSEIRADVLPALDMDWLNWTVSQAGFSGSIIFHLINSLKQVRDKQREGIAKKLAETETPIDAMTDKLTMEYQKHRPGIRQKHFAFIDALQNLISLDHSHFSI